MIDDWSSFGQRTTLSGTVLLDGVRVPKTHVVPGYKGYETPTADGAIFQIIQAAVDTGIARGTIEETVRFVKTSTRAWVDSGFDHAWQDPYTIQAVGDLSLRLHATQALLEKAGLAIDAAVAAPSADSVAKAQIAVAEAKVLSTEIAIAATNKLFELGGTRSTLAVHNFDRHWRKRAHPHAARSRALEVCDPRQLRAERCQPAAARLELSRDQAADAVSSVASCGVVTTVVALPC